MSTLLEVTSTKRTLMARCSSQLAVPTAERKQDQLARTEPESRILQIAKMATVKGNINEPHLYPILKSIL